MDISPPEAGFVVGNATGATISSAEPVIDKLMKDDDTDAKK
jgi:hypothetical protein